MRRALVALALLSAACSGGSHTPSASTTTSTTASAKPVRIGVWMPPDPSANTYGGAVIRSLLYPQLFRATPAGTWRASLVEPGTDRTGAGATTASFRLRRGAKWSDGTPITVSDLRRTLDGRFVTALDDPTPGGTIRAHFTQALPGWRRLWSGLETVAPPHEGLFGGPYKLGTVTPGFETVLVANDAYFGAKPAIREAHFVLVPDPEIAARLMARGDLDVIAPPAYSGRTARLARIAHAHVLTAAAGRGGWTAAFVANPTRLNLDQRLFLLAPADGPRFTDVLLHGEATSLGGGVQPANTAKPAFSGTPAFTTPDESQPGGVLLHAMQRKEHKAGFDFDLRDTEFDNGLAAYAAGDYDVVFRLEPSSVDTCWTCRYASVDADLAKAADAHDRAAIAALRRKLVTEGLELPLWREKPVAAVRDGLVGVSLNPYDAAGPVWDLQQWRWD